ncbi:MAG: Peptidyl-tRNA hydrolase [Microgenomates group bacterium GW2011_GWC1_37_8]|uniref:Peptidyl-tRNA hydrolase n=1 Tax=Candidatus Woesebacteria bacterium GW2011_GWB1_38_8 TaxID=1618570 RepID=A0A0G0LAU8_9BACT|nr:MAG: Peptidyl-tRNA hydrolase [Microgenomates group bacterium GW2011_GWC1_37_8]KKQ85000.1 MAG: Peptidyl-tRNA hydrolase [Candidatus Woesebacteria bacterium GW2011_GWB1_38_8]
MGNKLTVGLGNPGEKYTNTRHNVGFMVIDAIASQISNFQFPISNWAESRNAKALYCSARIKGKEIEFVKPWTFMNQSGLSVRYAYKKHSLKPDDLYVIHDDLDLRLGTYKIQKGVGPKLHNGIDSIERELGTKVFWRVRVGVDNRQASGPGGPPDRRGEQYVLQDFTGEEFEILNSTIENIVKDILSKLAVFGK